MSLLAISELFRASLFRTGDLEEAIRETRRRVVAAEKILALVAEVASIPVEQVRTGQRTPEIVARWVAALLLAEAGYTPNDLLRAMSWDRLTAHRADANRTRPDVEDLLLRVRARRLSQ